MSPKLGLSRHNCMSLLDVFKKKAATTAPTAIDAETVAQEQRYRAGTLSVIDLVAPSALEISPSFLRLNGRFVRTLFVITYPRYIRVGWFTPIINFNHPLDISMFFYPVKADTILKDLKKRVGNLEAEIIAEREKGAPRDPIKETALQDIEKLRDDITQGVEHFFQFALYITLYADSQQELDELTGDIEDALGSRLVYSKRVLYQAEQGFTSSLPVGFDQLAITFNMNTSPCASSFPFISFELSSDDGIMYGINRHNNSLILFDRFSLQNANMVVFATAGSGKSYAIKLEILRSLMLGTDIIVIDPEKEYLHLCQAVGGTYIDISLSSDSKVNPFDLPRPIDKDMTTADIIRSAIITLKGLIRLMIGNLNSTEDSVVDRALKETYAKKDITSDSDLASVEPPVMQDLVEILEGMEGGADLALRLKKYTEGTFAGFTNHPTNVDVNNRFVAFGVRDLQEELRPIGIYNLINYIWNVVRSDRKKRILVIDEAWWLLQNEDSAKFIYALVKRCRKYYLGVTTITQDVNDFLLSPYGQSIVNNSALRLLMKQSETAIEQVQKTFLLTEGEKYFLLASGVGQGIFFAGNNHAAIQVIASYVEDQLITTDPRQLLELEAAKAAAPGGEATPPQPPV